MLCRDVYVCTTSYHLIPHPTTYITYTSNISTPYRDTYIYTRYVAKTHKEHLYRCIHIATYSYIAY
jgi:hypothetical protein